jgi:hypothetical protein
MIIRLIFIMKNKNNKDILNIMSIIKIILWIIMLIIIIKQIITKKYWYNFNK